MMNAAIRSPWFRACASLPLVLLAVACGGSRPPVATGPTVRGGSGVSADDPILTCHDDGSDYRYVASYACSDGSVPLGSDAQRGRAARVGNVGAGVDGHIVDLYEIPCASGPVRLYVDMYHCSAEGDPQPDAMNLTDDQLRSLAYSIRQLEQEPLSARSIDARAELAQWVAATPQVHVQVCESVFALLGSVDAYPYRDALLQQFVVSLAAGVIELSDGPADRAEVNFRALAAVVGLYAAIAEREGPSATLDGADRLLQQDGATVHRAVEEAVSRCR